MQGTGIVRLRYPEWTSIRSQLRGSKMIKCTRKYADKTPLKAVQRLKNWMTDADGAVTVDWVVLTATMAVIGGIIVVMTVDGTTDVGNQISAVLADKPVN